MALAMIACCHCGKKSQKERGAISRAKRRGMPLYCNRTCAGLARRSTKTEDEKKSEKAAYDKNYRTVNKEKLKVSKAEYHLRTYDPEKARIERKKHSERHKEYCRQPEYKAWKKQYDRTYRAKKFYGDFWESFLLTMDIRNECLNQSSDYEIRLANQTLNKRLQRKRHATAKCDQSKNSPLGNLECCEERRNATEPR